MVAEKRVWWHSQYRLVSARYNFLGMFMGNINNTSTYIRIFRYIAFLCNRQIVINTNYRKASFSRARNFANRVKRKFEETIFTNWHWWFLRSQAAIITFSMSDLRENSVWPIVRLELTITLYHTCLATCKWCTLRYDNSRKTRFCIVSNSGMHVDRSFTR